MLKEKLSLQKHQVFLNILPDLVDILMLKNGELQLFNTFAYKTNTDFQYFILNTFDQLGLSPLDIPVSVMGLTTRDDQKIENLKKFIKRINFIGKPSHFEYAFGFNELPEHYFINLLNLYQCG